MLRWQDVAMGSQDDDNSSLRNLFEAPLAVRKSVRRYDEAPGMIIA
jgi:hypothetical protein